MRHRERNREAARVRLSEIEREIAAILRTFPDLRPRRHVRRRLRHGDRLLKRGRVRQIRVSH